MAVATVFATISDGSVKDKGLMVLVGGFAGALPDFDVISLWSKFDATIGSWLHLQLSGKDIYFSKLWYSHRGGFHSLLAPVVLILAFIVINSIRVMLCNLAVPIPQNKIHNSVEAGHALSRFKRKIFYGITINKWLCLSFFFGFVFHLLEDMPTPASVWGGVRFLYPSAEYVGGFGKIWWWNNYDLTLIIISVLIINLVITVLPRQLYKVKVPATVFVFLLGASVFLFQLNNRPVDFAYTGYTKQYNELESQSKQVQKQILGDKLFAIMTAIDNKIPFAF